MKASMYLTFVGLIYLIASSNISAHNNDALSTEGGAVCTITCPNEITVDLAPGECSVEVTYSVTATMCTGSIIQTSGLPSGSEFPIGVTQNCFQIQSASCCFDVIVNEFPNPTTTLACNDNVQVSVNENCEALVSTDMILEGGPYACYEDYIVTVQNYGSGFGGVFVNSDAVGQTLSVTVTDPETGNECYGTISVEDKVPPEIECSPYGIECGDTPDPFDPDYLSASDNCGPVDLTFTDEVEDDPGMSTLIIRHWVATDASGNTSTCDQEITLEGCCTPFSQASHISFINIASNQMTVEWYNGSGSHRIVKINTVNSFTPPVDGTDPDPESHYDGSGEQVVYNGNADNFIVTGLSPNTSYCFRVYEAQNCSGFVYYNTMTAVQNPKCQNSGSGVINTFLVQTKTPFKVPGHPNPSTLLSGSTNQPAQELKICADGSRATIFKFTNQNPNINTNDIRFIVQDDPMGANPALFGKFNPSDYTVIGNTVTALFTHPEFLPESYKPFRSDQINIIATANPSSPIYVIPVKIFRAPIVFVHGWTGTPETFEKMNSDLVKSNYYTFPLTTKVYYATSLESFAVNSGVVREWINTAFDYSLKGKFSAGQVDVVGHSMGGILTRLYQQNNYGNKYRGDINKIITLNTPHSGSYLANAVTLLTLPFSAPFCGANQLFGTQHWICSGATLNMQTYSAPIDKVLNSPQSLAINHIPSHTITSTILLNPPSNYSQEPISLSGPILSGLLKAYKKIIGVILDDGVVTLSAQTGGLTGSKTSNPIMHFHIGTAREPIIIDKVIELLCENPFSGSFELNGFEPPNLPFQPPFPTRKQSTNPQAERLSVNLQILSPVSGSTHFSGDQITIQTEFESGVSSLQCLIGNPVIGYNSVDTVGVSSPTDIHYILPDKAIGNITIGVIGFDSNGFIVASDSISINVAIASAMDSLSIFPKAIFVGTELQRDFAVYGHFADSLTRDITHVSSFLIDDIGVAKIVGPGRIEGILIDTTTLTVNYLGSISDAIVHVYDGDSLRHALFDSDNNIICDSGYVSFKNFSTGNPTNYLWQFECGEPSMSTDINPTVYYDKLGEHTVSLIAYYSNRSDTITIPGYTTVSLSPVIELSHSDHVPLCEGSEVILTASVQPNDYFIWSNDSSSHSIIVNEPGAFSLFAFNTYGCYTISDTVQVMSYSNPKPVISGILSVCPGSSTSLNVDGNFTQINWSTGETEQEIQVSNPGPVTVMVIDSNGCSGISSEVILFQLDSAEAEILALGPTSFCNGDSVFLIVNESSVYEWSQGDTGQHIVVYDAGLYTVTVFDSNGCSAISNAIQITTHSLPVVDFGFDTIFTTKPIILDAGDSNNSYSWNTKDTTQIIHVTSPGEYSVTITDSNGCQASDSVHVQFITSTTYGNELQGIHVYPNPNQGSFQLECKRNGLYTLGYEIFDRIGRIVVSDHIESIGDDVETLLSIPNATPGIYFLRLRVGSNTHIIKLVVL